MDNLFEGNFAKGRTGIIKKAKYNTNSSHDGVVFGATSQILKRWTPAWNSFGDEDITNCSIWDDNGPHYHDRMQRVSLPFLMSWQLKGRRFTNWRMAATITGTISQPSSYSNPYFVSHFEHIPHLIRLVFCLPSSLWAYSWLLPIFHWPHKTHQSLNVPLYACPALRSNWPYGDICLTVTI